MNEPRPTTISALPCEMRSSVAKSWKTRTGSSALWTWTALARRIRPVRAAAAERMTAGDVSRNSRRWCSPIPKTSSPTWSASSISARRFLIRSAWLSVTPVTGSAIEDAKLSIPNCIRRP